MSLKILLHRMFINLSLDYTYQHCGFQKPIICMHLIINDRGVLFVKCLFIYHLDSTNKQKLVVKASF